MQTGKRENVLEAGGGWSVAKTGISFRGAREIARVPLDLKVVGEIQEAFSVYFRGRLDGKPPACRGLISSFVLCHRSRFLTTVTDPKAA